MFLDEEKRSEPEGQASYVRSFIPVPETSYAVHCAVEEARKARASGEEKTILFNWSGHGLLDLSSYQAYFEGKLEHRK